jgi:hypothetical protein
MAKRTRRSFLKRIIIGGAALYIGGWWLFKVRKGDATDYIKSVLKKHLGYLKLEKNGVDQFAYEFQNRISPRRRYWGSWIGIVGPLYSAIDLLKVMPKSQKFKVYVQFYDTFETGCANPFAQF